jgi:hypothetical protein
VTGSRRHAPPPTKYGAAPLQLKAASLRPGAPPPAFERGGASPIQAKPAPGHVPPQPRVAGQGGAIVQRQAAPGRPAMLGPPPTKFGAPAHSPIQRSAVAPFPRAIQRMEVPYPLVDEYFLTLSGPFVGSHDGQDYINFKIETSIGAKLPFGSKISDYLQFSQRVRTTATISHNGHILDQVTGAWRDDKYSANDLVASGSYMKTVDRPGVQVDPGNSLRYNFRFKQQLVVIQGNRVIDTGEQAIVWSGSYDDAENGRNKVDQVITVLNGGSSYEQAITFY